LAEADRLGLVIMAAHCFTFVRRWFTSPEVHIMDCGTKFVATTNEKALTATTLAGRPKRLQGIIEKNKAFRKAFSLEQNVGRRVDPNPQDGPRPQILQSSAGSEELAYPANWGLVSSIVEAYNRHHELVLRPDDVWQAIITQFSFYVNANAEELRDCFVDFQGQKTLVVYMGGTLHTADYAAFANRMVDENITKNIKDPSVARWLIPDFSTTTAADRVAASVAVMSTLQAYFNYACCLCCGIPKVTLLGTPADWRDLRARVDRLPNYDLSSGHMVAWHALLVPVLDQFVLAAEGKPDIQFWDCVCSRHGGGSGPSYLSGWVTVFACFTHKGTWQGSTRPSGGSWPMVDFDKLPVGAVAVPVLVDDNGVQYDTQMLAGQFAYEACGDEAVALRPRTDWCIAYPGEAKVEPQSYVHGEIREAP